MSISLTEHVQAQPVALVSEKEYEYGADTFEAYQKEGKVKTDMAKIDVADIKSKSR